MKKRKDDFAIKLCILRRGYLGARQYEVAEALGISPASYGKYERGINKPAFSILVKMQKIFGLKNYYWLLGGEDVMMSMSAMIAEDKWARKKLALVGVNQVKG